MLSCSSSPPIITEIGGTGADPVPIPVRQWVSELSRRKMWIYWLDFLVSVSSGYAAFIFFPLARPLSWQGFLCFAITVYGFYRSVVFTHEIAHMPQGRFRSFRVVWNLICGIPLLVPSFLYEMHYEHHSRSRYGTSEDGEYVSFARLPRRTTLIFVLTSLLVTPALVLRFLILAPLRWIYPPLSSVVLTRGSALAIDAEYIRPLRAKKIPRSWALQEGSCFGWCAVMTWLLLTGRVATGRLMEATATVTVIAVVNASRVLAAHRYRGSGEPMSFAEQVLDSNDFPSILAELWAPVGLRYHAMHHLFPHLPYHALPEARRRVMAWADSRNPIRETSRGTLVSALRDLLRRRMEGR